MGRIRRSISPPRVNLQQSARPETLRPTRKITRQRISDRPVAVKKTGSKRISRSGRSGKGRVTRTRIGSGPIPPKIKRVQRPQPPLQKVSRVPPVTQFGSGSSAIKNVFGLIEQTSLRSAAKKEQFKREGRTGSLFFDSFFDEEFL